MVFLAVIALGDQKWNYTMDGPSPGQGVRERARVPQLVMLCRWRTFNALLGTPVALMEQLQAIVKTRTIPQHQAF